MTGEERRQQLLSVASALFAERGYRDTTTAQLAAAAKVTEPVIYRYFADKRQLYVECVQSAWEEVRDALAAAVAAQPDAERWVDTMSAAGLATLRTRGAAQLWLQLYADAGNDPELRRFAVAHLREVHALVRGVYEQAQQQGGVVSGRDVDAEAWTFIAVGLLAATTTRLGEADLVDFERLVEARRSWLQP